MRYDSDDDEMNALTTGDPTPASTIVPMSTETVHQGNTVWIYIPFANELFIMATILAAIAFTLFLLSMLTYTNVWSITTAIWWYLTLAWFLVAFLYFVFGAVRVTLAQPRVQLQAEQQPLTSKITGELVHGSTFYKKSQFYTHLSSAAFQIFMTAALFGAFLTQDKQFAHVDTSSSVIDQVMKADQKSNTLQLVAMTSAISLAMYLMTLNVEEEPMKRHPEISSRRPQSSSTGPVPELVAGLDGEIQLPQPTAARHGADRARSHLPSRTERRAADSYRE